jgi:hypothetical protein
LIYSDFEAWATFCDTNSLTVAGYLDTQLTRKAVLDAIGAAGMATIVPRGSKWGVIIDQVRSPVQTFSSDNIVDGTFEEEFLFANRANTALVWYFDKDQDYRKTAMEVRVADTESDETRKVERTFFFVDNETQAKKHANVLLNKSQLVKRIMHWEAFADAINCQPGDVVYLQNNLPIWGVTPGRVDVATSTSVTCDNALDFDDSEWNGRDLRILVRHQTPDTGEYVDDIERHPITNPYPSTGVTTYNLASATFARTPAADALVMIGWVTGAETSTSDELLSVKEVEILNIEHLDGNRYKITAAEYYDDSYAQDYVVSDLPALESGISVDNLTGDTDWTINGNTQVDKIVLSWTGDAERYYIYYRAYVTDESEWGPWRYHSTAFGTTAVISDLPAGLTYRFSVNVINAPNTSQTEDVDFDLPDWVDVIDAPTNLRCIDTGDATWDAIDLDIAWDAPAADFAIAFYKVEVWNAAESAVLRTYEAHRDKPGFTYTLEMNAQDHGGTASDSVKIKVSMVDTSPAANESGTAITEFTNASPDPVTSLQTTAGSGSAFSGPDVDLVWTAPGDGDLLHYEVAFNHGGGDLRTERVTDTQIKYTKAMNVEDGSGTASNAVGVKVYAVDVYGNYRTHPRHTP